MEVSAFQNIPGLTSSSSKDENKNPNSLGQDEFLELMTTQLTNQDPFEPMDNGEFLGQIAQFGTVNGINELLTSFQSLSTNLQSSQALQASNLIGRQVLVSGNEAYLKNTGGFSGAADLRTSANDVAVNIYDSTDSLVGRVELGARPAGLLQFNWDGTTLGGQRAPSGRYRIEVEATRNGEAEILAPMVNANVVSLTLGGVGKEMQVELENLGQVAFSRVNKIL